MPISVGAEGAVGKPGSQLLLLALRLGCCKLGKAELPQASAPWLRLLRFRVPQRDPPSAASRTRFGARTTCSLTSYISSRHCCPLGTAVTSSTTHLRSSHPASCTSCARCCPWTRWEPWPEGVARTTQARAHLCVACAVRVLTRYVLVCC